MTIRYYVLPMERNAEGNSRGPKYLAWKKDPDPPGIDCPWSPLDFGSVDVLVVATDVTTAQHNSLISHTDVLSIPTNLNNTLNAGAVNTARTFLEGLNVPAGWITTGMTYRTVLRTVCGFFIFFQRVNGFYGTDIPLVGSWPDLTMANVPVAIRDAMAQAAASFGYDYSWVTGTTTVREILKTMADDWGSQPILFGFTTL